MDGCGITVLATTFFDTWNQQQLKQLTSVVHIVTRRSVEHWTRVLTALG